MIRRVLFAAILAGLVAGIVVTAVQQTRITPLILHAETFEASAPPAVEGHSHAHDAAPHGHDAEAWAPDEGLERMGFSLLANILTATGFGLLLTAGFALYGKPVGVTRGVMWGLAGFGAFWLAPALGLPPELPGLHAAELSDRQAWYAGTVIATGSGIAMLAFLRGRIAKGAGVLLILAPHVIGAPHPETLGGGTPPELAAMFVMASLLGAAVLWVVLGGVSGYLYDRLAKTA
ncbi:MAG: CbtA family protein [Alphaproteobacteria bacterium]